MTREQQALVLCYSAFWLKPDSIFGLFVMTTFIKGSVILTMPSNPGPFTTFDAGSGAFSSRLLAPVPCGTSGLCPRAIRQVIAALPYLIGYR